MPLHTNTYVRHVKSPPMQGLYLDFVFITNRPFTDVGRLSNALEDRSGGPQSRHGTSRRCRSLRCGCQLPLQEDLSKYVLPHCFLALLYSVYFAFSLTKTYVCFFVYALTRQCFIQIKYSALRATA